MEIDQDYLRTETDRLLRVSRAMSISSDFSSALLMQSIRIPVDTVCRKKANAVKNSKQNKHVPYISLHTNEMYREML